jgi:hypothetical protein
VLGDVRTYGESCVISVELDQLDTHSAQAAATCLVARTQQRTVPQVFICGQYIGGELVKRLIFVIVLTLERWTFHIYTPIG